ncbi:hypothetical protein, partial [Streptomyces coeruleorubidus]|uniref:hypothetical protein n=1 Tax=Streptomyces coeruleorubidus TaxID=116188 RepID=UPI0034041640
MPDREDVGGAPGPRPGSRRGRQSIGPLGARPWSTATPRPAGPQAAAAAGPSGVRRLTGHVLGIGPRAADRFGSGDLVARLVGNA